MADVIAIFLTCGRWKATGCMLQHWMYGRCYCQVAKRMATTGWVTVMADVITKVADGIATIVGAFLLLFLAGGTLHHKVKTICSSPQLLQQEDDHLFKVLTKCKYPAWDLNRVKIKTSPPAPKNKRKGTNN